MVQNYDYPWRQPLPLPLIHQPSSSQNETPPEQSKTATPATRAQESLPPQTPPVFPNDDYQWMILL